MRSKHGRSAIGPVWPKPAIDTMMTSRLIDRRGLVAEAPAGQHPGTEILHDDVRVADQLSRYPAPVLGLEVDADRALSPVLVDVRPGSAVDPGTVGAVRVAMGRLFDLDHVGAEVHEQAGTTARPGTE